MKFILKKVGPIREAEIELAKLTLVCGRNNTGKTYLVNCVSDAYKQISASGKVHVAKNVPSSCDALEIDLNDYSDSVVDSVKKIVDSYSSRSPLLHGGSLQVVLDKSELPVFRSAPGSRWTMPSDLGVINFNVDKMGSVLRVERSFSVKEAGHLNVNDLGKFWQTALEVIVTAYFFKQAYNGGMFGNVFPVTSERMGIVYFRDALDMAARAWRPASSKDGKIVESSRESEAARAELFPDNVNAMLNFVNWLGQSAKTRPASRRSIIDSLSKSLSELADGDFRIEDGTVLYSPASDPSVKIGVQETSSSVRSLFFLEEYVRHAAKKGDLIVIDEPEMNLHPSKARQLARFVARLVNAGIKVLITTHSDYFVRELNTLVMLEDDDPRMSEIAAKYGYDRDELLDVSDIKGYVLEDGLLSPLPLSQETGFEVDSFDSAAREINGIQSEILFGGRIDGV